MEYIAYDISGSITATVIVLVIGCVIALLGMACFAGFRGFMVGTTLVILAILVVAPPQQHAAIDDQLTKFGAQAEDVYGVQLSVEQVGDLEYPRTPPDDGARAIYGTTVVETGAGYQEVALVWADDELQLVGLSDSGPGTELPRHGASKR